MAECDPVPRQTDGLTSLPLFDSHFVYLLKFHSRSTPCPVFFEGKVPLFYFLLPAPSWLPLSGVIRNGISQYER